MAKQIWTPVGRLVQGGFKLHEKKDDNDQLVRDKDGNVVKECYMALAVPKLDPDGQPNREFARWWAEINGVAAVECAAFYDASQGRATHPGFSWKYQDGDGVDGNGKPVAGKPGFAGHHIIKMSTQFPPRAYHEGRWAPGDVIQNPDDVIKTGYYCRMYCRVAGNGVTAADRNKKPGVFVSPELVSLVAYGEVIVTGVDAAAAAAQAPAIGALPAGASATPVAGSQTTAAPPAPGGVPGGLAPPPAPGGMAPPAAPTAAPAPPVAAPAMAPPPPPAPVPQHTVVPTPAPIPAAPQLVLVGAFAGYSLDALKGQGWTEDMLIAQGHAVRQ